MTRDNKNEVVLFGLFKQIAKTATTSISLRNAPWTHRESTERRASKVARGISQKPPRRKLIPVFRFYYRHSALFRQAPSSPVLMKMDAVWYLGYLFEAKGVLKNYVEDLPCQKVRQH